MISGIQFSGYLSTFQSTFPSSAILAPVGGDPQFAAQRTSYLTVQPKESGTPSNRFPWSFPSSQASWKDRVSLCSRLHRRPPLLESTNQAGLAPPVCCSCRKPELSCVSCSFSVAPSRPFPPLSLAPYLSCLALPACLPGTCLGLAPPPSPSLPFQPNPIPRPFCSRAPLPQQ